MLIVIDIPVGLARNQQSLLTHRICPSKKPDASGELPLQLLHEGMHVVAEFASPGGDTLSGKITAQFKSRDLKVFCVTVLRQTAPRQLFKQAIFLGGYP